jgi:hypothetical protein
MRYTRDQEPPGDERVEVSRPARAVKPTGYGGDQTQQNSAKQSQPGYWGLSIGDSHEHPPANSEAKCAKQSQFRSGPGRPGRIIGADDGNLYEDGHA